MTTPPTIDTGKDVVVWMRTTAFDDGSNLLYCGLRAKATGELHALVRYHDGRMRHVWEYGPAEQSPTPDRFVESMIAVSDQALAAIVRRGISVVADTEARIPEYDGDGELIDILLHKGLVELADEAFPPL